MYASTGDLITMKSRSATTHIYMNSHAEYKKQQLRKMSGNFILSGCIKKYVCIQYVNNVFYINMFNNKSQCFGICVN